MGIQIFVLFSESYIQKKTFKVGSHCELRSTKERQALTLSVSRKILLVHKIYTHTQKYTKFSWCSLLSKKINIFDISTLVLNSKADKSCSHDVWNNISVQ